jgi:hypothetical protein
MWKFGGATMPFIKEEITRTRYYPSTRTLEVSFSDGTSTAFCPASPQDVRSFKPGTNIVQLVETLTFKEWAHSMDFTIGMVRVERNGYGKAIINEELRRFWRRPEPDDAILPRHIF